MNIIFMLKIYNFRADLTDVSDQTKSPVLSTFDQGI